MRKLANRIDLWIVIAILAVSGLFLMIGHMQEGSSQAEAVIAYEGETVMTLTLYRGQEERDFSLSQVPEVTFHLYTDGSIAFTRSDCPDQVCVQSGRLSRGGEFAACVPHRLSLRLVAGDGPDAIIP